MAKQTEGGASAEPQQITVEQLAAQLAKKAPPDAGAQTADAPAPDDTPSGEAPEGGPAGTESDLSQSASTEAGGAAEAQSEPGEGGESEPAAPAWYQKRIAKFTAKQKEMEERLVAAERRAEEAAAKLDETRKAAAAGGKPKVWNHAEQEIQQQLAHKREVLRWAEENPEGATLADEKGNEVSYTPEQVRAIKLSALEDIGDLRGQLREHQQGLTAAREHHDAEALKAYPDLKDANSELSRNVERMLERLPWLREVPDARISLADMLAGRAIRLKRGAGTAAGTAAPAKTTPRAPGAAGTAPARKAEDEPSEELKQANQTFQETGRVTDLARRFALERKV